MTVGRRRLALGAAVVLSAAGLAGCGEGSRATAVSPGARHALAGRVLDIMDGHGLPVEDDYIGCLAGSDGHSDDCYGETADEPVQQILGRFRTDGTGTCAGTLTITLGPPVANQSGTGPTETVRRVGEDPCR